MSLIYGLRSLNAPLEDGITQKIAYHSNFFDADKVGIWQNKSIGLGNLLIYNTPEALDEQLPFRHSYVDVTISADVRLDNRDELIKHLQIKNPKITDSELILETYLKYGVNCLQHFIGAFAFIIWDARYQRLFCARDHLGVRPLFYYYKNNLLTVASMIKPMLAIPHIDKGINAEYVNNIIIGLHQTEGATFYEHILELLPAHFLLLENNTLQLEQYWELDEHQETVFKNPNDYQEAFFEHLETAIKCRLRTHHKVGAELSGGLDSSGISALAQKYLTEQGKELYTYSHLLPPEDFGKIYPYNDESQEVAAVCKMANIKHNTKITKMYYDSILQSLDIHFSLFDGVHLQDGLGVDGIRQAAQKQNVGVLLSGFPGDELVTSFANKFYLEYLDTNKYLKYLKYLLGSSGKKRLTYLFIYKLSLFLGKPVSNKIKSLFYKTRGLTQRDYEQIFFKSNTSYYETAISVLKQELIKPDEEIINLKVFQKNLFTQNVTFRMGSENIAGFLRKVETRYPLGDIRLCQFVLSIPHTQKRNEEHGRLLFRKVIDPYLPKMITWKKAKEGSTSAFWFKEYQNLHPEIIKWWSELKNNNKFNAIDINRLIEKSFLVKNIDKLPKGQIPLSGRQTYMMYLMRYFELHPELNLNTYLKQTI